MQLWYLSEKAHIEKVKFIGRIQYDQLPRYIAMGDVFAMPSRSRLFGLEVEGLGIVYLEASACGLPVIGGASGGAPDAVEHGVTGFVVDGNNIDEIARRAVELLRDKELREKMGNAGRKWVVDEWRWQIWSERFNNALKIGS
jgi:phosphatidyl-myo-inositol dimannoside synthase